MTACNLPGKYYTVFCNIVLQSLFEALQGILFLSLALPYSSIGALVDHSATFYLWVIIEYPDNKSSGLVHIFSPEKNTDKNNDFRRPLIPMICEFLSESETVFAQLPKKSDHKSTHWKQTLHFFNYTYFSCQIKSNNYYSIFLPLSALINSRLILFLQEKIDTIHDMAIR